MTVRIQYSAQTALGKLSAQCCNRLLDTMAEVARLRDALYASSYPDDWASLEAEVGVEAGQGQEFFALWDGVNQALADPRFSQLNKIDQG